MYSPTIGRFLQRDPIGYYDSMNLYQAVGNNPINYLDPLGLCGENSNPWDELQKYLIEVGAVMETKYTVNMQDLFGQVGFAVAGYANVGFIPKGIGYGNTNFLEGGRIFYSWANQYGSGVKVYSAAQIGVASGFLSVIGAAMSGYSIGETIDSYYYGYIKYKEKYGE
jgi:hypothetical protein